MRTTEALDAPLVQVQNILVSHLDGGAMGHAVPSRDGEAARVEQQALAAALGYV